MKPTLILLNGTPAAGKSTMLSRYIDAHPMTLGIDIDQIWFMMGQWQASRPRSHVQKMKLAFAMTETHLKDGFDVLIAQHLESPEYYDQLEAIAAAHNARFIEIMLMVPYKENLKRFIRRGKASGYPTGWRPGGIMDTEGREKKLREMYEQMRAALKTRPNAVVLSPKDGDEAGTYKELLRVISGDADV